MTMVTTERLHQLHIYEPDTGLYISKRLNRPIGYKAPHSGWVLRIDKKPHLIHRLAFIWQGLELPDGLLVDHINGDRWDNRWDNLRLVTPAQNAQNRKLHSNSSTGVKGVNRQTWNRDRFEASITVQGTRYHLGTFDTIEEASDAYEEAATKYFGDYKRS